MYLWSFAVTIYGVIAIYGTDFSKGSGDPNCTLLRYQARLEASCHDNITEARLLWQEVMKARGRHANYWLEYANMERLVMLPWEPCISIPSGHMVM